MGRKPTDSPAHGRVTVCPTGHRGGVVRRPDGSVLPTPRSQTAGIQEAVDFATSHGCDMYIAGGVEPGKGGPVIYTCDRTVKIPPVQGFTFGTGSVTLYFTPEVGDKPGLEFDSAMLTDFSLSGQVYYEANGPAVRFAPSRQLPLDAETVITDSFFRFGAVAVDGGPKADCVAFAPKGGGIVYNTFEFGEINGGARGIVVESPAPTKAFASNRLACMHVHDQTQVCVQVGHEPTNGIFANNWTLDTTIKPPGPCIVTGGRNDTWHVSIGNALGEPDQAIVLGESAGGNHFYAPHFSGRLVNGADEQTNRLHLAGPREVSQIPIDRSPWSYQNRSCLPETLYVQGGSVDEISISADGREFFASGAAEGAFHLDVGMAVRISFVRPPTVRCVR